MMARERLEMLMDIKEKNDTLSKLLRLLWKSS